MIRTITAVTLAAGMTLALAGCGQTTGERAVSGGLIGAIAGGGRGAAIGALAGGATGAAAGALTTPSSGK